MALKSLVNEVAVIATALFEAVVVEPPDDDFLDDPQPTRPTAAVVAIAAIPTRLIEYLIPISLPFRLAMHQSTMNAA
jgi:hypothetical protein